MPGLLFVDKKLLKIDQDRSGFHIVFLFCTKTSIIESFLFKNCLVKSLQNIKKTQKRLFNKCQQPCFGRQSLVCVCVHTRHNCLFRVIWLCFIRKPIIDGFALKYKNNLFLYTHHIFFRLLLNNALPKLMYFNWMFSKPNQCILYYLEF